MRLKGILIAIMCFYFQSSIAQKLTTKQQERLKYKVHIFTTNEKELQELWYEDRMDQMKLKGELREDYKKVIIYHAYKMERLDDADKKLTDDQVLENFQKQLQLMNTDVREILNDKQFAIHKKTWKVLTEAIYEKKNWKNKL